ncbi:MAG TPA: response regulator [Nitrospirae bacterium]|nr:response regulator [Nitrospirota bacterium]
MGNLTILIIEDNPLNMKLVRDLLQFGKYNVLEATDAKTGIQLAREHKPALILMDIQLPGMDGLNATRLIRNDLILKDIPVVALTSHAMRGDDQKIREAGCDGYISKPIDTRNFLERLQPFLQEDTNNRKSLYRKKTSYKNRILIACNNPLSTRLLAAKLPHAKYKVISASDETEILEKVLKESPHLILLDSAMPVMNRYGMTGQLKTDPETRDIPIIMLTTFDEKDNQKKAMEADIDEFINKPVNSKELIARISSVLRFKQYREQLAIRRESEEPFMLPLNYKELVQSAIDLPLVLCVENSGKDSGFIQSWLEGQPCRIAAARNGEEAISLAQQEKTDLILLDINLPGMKGSEVCRRLKEMYCPGNIPVIVIAHLQELEKPDAIIEQGIDDYLIKPVNLRELQARINILLKKKACMDILHSNYETALNSTIIDGSTGLYNHRYFKRSLELQVKSSLHHGYPVCLVTIDMDNIEDFTAGNSRLTGDMVLSELARVIKNNIREIDLAARCSTDKIAVILPYYNKEKALIIVEKIRNDFASGFSPDKTPLQPDNMTFCTGIASCPSDASTAEELIRHTDVMLLHGRESRKSGLCL